MRRKIGIVVGTRPEIIKMQPIIKEIEKRNEFELCFIHAGQHYDWLLSGGFIQELALAQPAYFLKTGSGSHGKQTARILSRLEPLLRKEKPDVVLLEGDTNSALGSALTAAKLGLKVGHVEAGCRSFDRSMPEEINRILISDLASFHFAPTHTCAENLLHEGISQESIFLTGHPIVDVLSYMKERVRSVDVLSRFNVMPEEFYFATVHRDKNVDHRTALLNILKALNQIGKIKPVIFSAHPRTTNRIKQFRLQKYLNSVTIVEPLDLASTLKLIQTSKTVITDSGGIQQEALLLGTPCVTLRDTTEWVETIHLGVNYLVGSNPDKIVHTVRKIEDDFAEIKARFTKARGFYGRVGVSKKILDILSKCN